jgi:hypothetical protein
MMSKARKKGSTQFHGEIFKAQCGGLISCLLIQQVYFSVCNGFSRPGRCRGHRQLTIGKPNQGFNRRLTNR